MKWKTDKNDGVRQSKCGYLSAIVFQYGVKNNMGWWEYGIQAGDNTLKQGHAKTPETCMKACEKWIKSHLKTMQKDLKK